MIFLEKQIKIMTHNFKLIDKSFSSNKSKAQYTLYLNGNIHSVYPKYRYSKQEAEDAASDEVQKYIERYGYDNVSYDGALVTI